jgi:hypothetical protein
MMPVKPVISTGPAARAAAVMLLELSASRQQRVLRALSADQQQQITAALHQAKLLQLRLSDISGPAGLALFDCQNAEQVRWLRQCQQQQSQLTPALQSAFLQAVQSAGERR